MEDFNNEPSQTIVERNKGLWITPRLRMQLRQCSSIGTPLVILCMILVIAVALLAVNTLFIWTKGNKENLHLLSNGIINAIFPIITSLIAIYFFIRAIIEGYKSWKLLDKTDENDLLEGTERLSKMFRWLAIWGIFYVLTLMKEAI